MSNNWQPPQRNLPSSHSETERTRSGGLLKNYGSQQSPAGSGQQPQLPAPGQAGPPNTFLSNTVQLMRQWSGKLAKVAGYQEQPPAPYMDRYQTPMPVISEFKASGKPSRWKRSRILRITMQMRSRRERWLRTHPRFGIVVTSFLIALVLSMVMTAFGGTAYGYTYYQGQLPRLNDIAQQTMAQTTRIYDRNGVLLFEMFDTNEEHRDRGRRTPIKFSDAPRVLRDAIVSIEDDSFWSNAGISPEGILRAAINYVQGGDLQGASTIAQQVIKNLTGEDDVNMARKVSEAALAVGLTQQYSKEKILEMYMNVSPFGPMNLGVEAAVNEYFNLDRQCTPINSGEFVCTPGVSYLNKVLDGCEKNGLESCKDDPLMGLARASLLAGLPQNPGMYYPADEEKFQRALDRQKLVLGRMVDLKINVEGLGVLTPEIAKQASELAAQMTISGYTLHKRAPHFVDWVIDKVAVALGNGDPSAGYQAFITGGFNIRTTTSIELQEYVERAINHHLSANPSVTQDGFPLNGPQHNANSSAVVVMNSHTGEILAMNGSADYYNADPRVGGQYNIADPSSPSADGTRGRQPGSTFKPIVYAAAFEMGWYPGLVIPDNFTHFPSGNQGAGTPAPATEDQALDSGTYLYSPPDFDLQGRWNFTFHTAAPGGISASETTIRLSLQESLNVAAVKALKYAGPENVANVAHRLGISQVDPNLGISWALGTQEATVLQMTGAFQAFANNGSRIPPQGVLDIWDNYGNSLYHYDPTKPQAIQAISPQVAYLLTSMLIDEPSRALEFSPYHTLSFVDIDPSCTTQRECTYQVAAKTGTTDNFRDNWAIGYTPNVVVGTWTGNANNEPMMNILGISGAGTIWHSVIKAASGYCAMSVGYVPGIDENVECPADGLADRLGINKDLQFTNPGGVVPATVSSTTGLAGSGNTDYIIQGQEPQQAGYTGGNGNGNGNGNNRDEDDD